MFSILNSVAKLRKYSPQVCKFLDNLTGISHARLPAVRHRSYVIEQLGVRHSGLTAIGLPIALSSFRPAFAPFGGTGVRYIKGSATTKPTPSLEPVTFGH